MMSECCTGHKIFLASLRVDAIRSGAYIRIGNWDIYHFIRSDYLELWYIPKVWLSRVEIKRGHGSVKFLPGKPYRNEQPVTQAPDSFFFERARVLTEYGRAYF
jgi:hypothetical protein